MEQSGNAARKNIPPLQLFSRIRLYYFVARNVPIVRTASDLYGNTMIRENTSLHRSLHSPREEFSCLMELHLVSFERYVRAMVRDSETARDVVGETILMAYESFHTLRDPASFLFFLIAIARRQYWKLSRIGRRFARLQRSHEDLLIDDAPDPGSAHDVDLLNLAIAKLPAKQRETLALFELSGWSLNEIHALQGGSLSGVKTRLVRARKKLAAMLGENRAMQRIPVLDIPALADSAGHL
jgi:RNA polymerase sigma factor (sigma-70 family)